jgi:methionyl-tRNA formyltransferase
MRLVFIATGDIALPAFRRLIDAGPRPLALITQPDKPVGRHQIMQPSAIKAAAIEAGISVLQPQKIGDAADQIAALHPDILVVMAYGQILKNDILSLPKLAIINLHASLLPKYRGAACIQAAIDAGDRESGITSMHVVRELDAGDMIVAKPIPIEPDETGGSLHDRLAQLAIPVLDETLAKLADGSAARTPQNQEHVSHVPKLERDDGKLDWLMPAANLERRIRAYDPWPGTYTTVLENGSAKRLKIFPPTRISDIPLRPGMISCDDGKLIVGCGDRSLELTMVQPEGGKRMSATDYLRGKKPEHFA